jgi:hypothetical protein
MAEIKTREASLERSEDHLDKFMGQGLKLIPSRSEDRITAREKYHELSIRIQISEDIHEQLRSKEEITTIQEWFASDSLQLPSSGR